MGIINSMAAQATTSTSQKPAAFGLKGNLLTLTVMHLFQTEPQAIRQQLASTVAATPKFFTNMPIVIDLQHLATHEHPIDFLAISTLLREHGLIPVGVSNGTAEQLQAAYLAGLGTLSQIKREIPTTPSTHQDDHALSSPTRSRQDANKTQSGTAHSPGDEHAHSSQPSRTDAHNHSSKGNTASSSEPHKSTQSSIKATQSVDQAPSRSKVIVNPVRSGQQVYAKGGDLIVLAAVSAGAEILADGNIHVYGTLRGRALAGVQGDTSARIFCNGLQAELISIAGHYKLQDSIDAPSHTLPVQVYLENDLLSITLL
jgi:septum site-determining protein MinC